MMGPGDEDLICTGCGLLAGWVHLMPKMGPIYPNWWPIKVEKPTCFNLTLRLDVRLEGYVLLSVSMYSSSQVCRRRTNLHQRVQYVYAGQSENKPKDAVPSFQKRECRQLNNLGKIFGEDVQTHSFPIELWMVYCWVSTTFLFLFVSVTTTSYVNARKGPLPFQHWLSMSPWQAELGSAEEGTLQRTTQPCERPGAHMMIHIHEDWTGVCWDLLGSRSPLVPHKHPKSAYSTYLSCSEYSH